MTAHLYSTTGWIKEDIAYLAGKRQSDVGRKNSTGYLGLRAAFNFLRKMPKYSLIGDYPLIFGGARALEDLNMPITRKNVLSAMDASKDLKGRFLGKTELVKQLLNS